MWKCLPRDTLRECCNVGELLKFKKKYKHAFFEHLNFDLSVCSLPHSLLFQTHSISIMSQCIEHGKEGHVCNHGPSSFAESLDEVEFNRSIHAACTSNNLERVRTILAKQSRGESPACALDSAGYTALVGRRRSKKRKESTCFFWTLMLRHEPFFSQHYSSRAGNKEICTLLLNAGADVDAATPELGATPLMRAIQQGHLDVARLLVSYGASIDVRNSDQENIFHVLAIATSMDNTVQTSDKTEKSAAMALWLLTKLDKDRRIAMLTTSDAKGRRPVDYLKAGKLTALLTPPN